MRTCLSGRQTDSEKDTARNHIAAHGGRGRLANALVAAARVNFIEDAQQRVVGARHGHLGHWPHGGKVVFRVVPVHQVRVS